MPSQALFPTLVYKAPLQASGWKSFNERLLLECRQYREDDTAGQAWSATRYPGGYTSYGSLGRMQTISPAFALLERKLRRHVNRFARSLEPGGYRTGQHQLQLQLVLSGPPVRPKPLGRAARTAF